MQGICWVSPALPSRSTIPLKMKAAQLARQWFVAQGFSGDPALVTVCQRRLVGGGRILPNLIGTVERPAERGTGHPVLPGHGGHGHIIIQVLADGGELLPGETPWPAQLLALRPGGAQPRPGSAADALALLAGHVGRHAARMLPMKASGESGSASKKPVHGGHHQDVALGEQLVQEMPLGAGTARRNARDRDVGIDPPGINAGVSELAALHLGVAAGLPGVLVPAGADVAVGGHVSIIPFSARGSQERVVSISATGGIRAIIVRLGRLSRQLRRSGLCRCFGY